jgi:hypothetical protein
MARKILINTANSVGTTIAKINQMSDYLGDLDDLRGNFDSIYGSSPSLAIRRDSNIISALNMLDSIIGPWEERDDSTWSPFDNMIEMLNHIAVQAFKGGVGSAVVADSGRFNALNVGLDSPNELDVFKQPLSIPFTGTTQRPLTFLEAGFDVADSVSYFEHLYVENLYADSAIFGKWIRIWHDSSDNNYIEHYGRNVPNAYPRKNSGDLYIRSAFSRVDSVEQDWTVNIGSNLGAGRFDLDVVGLSTKKYGGLLSESAGGDIVHNAGADILFTTTGGDTEFDTKKNFESKAVAHIFKDEDQQNRLVLNQYGADVTGRVTADSATITYLDIPYPGQLGSVQTISGSGSVQTGSFVTSVIHSGSGTVSVPASGWAQGSLITIVSTGTMTMNWGAGSEGISLGSSTRIASGMSTGSVWYFSETVV